MLMNRLISKFQTIFLLMILHLLSYQVQVPPKIGSLGRLPGSRERSRRTMGASRWSTSLELRAAGPLALPFNMDPLHRFSFS
ncbi:MAG: hypothetical protein D6723_00505 [Acidobacteria bacterium]|nr:MAG: hypothetical protein D6723_00505 [Acidobacteriota bacterium]